MFRNNQNDLNYSPQEVGLGGGYGGYAGGAPVIAPTFVSAPTQPYGFAPPIAPVAPVIPGFGGGFGGFGGIGGGGILEAALLFGILGGNGFGNRGNQHDHPNFPFPFPNPCNDNNNPLAILAAIAGAKDATIGEGRAGLAAIANAKDTTVAESRALAAAICDSEKTTLQQFYAQAIQAANNTQSIKDQSANETALILSRINQSEVDSLRDRLDLERRGRDNRELEVRIENTNTNVNTQIQAQSQLQAQAQLQRDLDEHRRRFDNREIEINNINTNTNVQAQLQAQSQRQAIVDLDRDHRINARFDALINQQNKVAQDIINIGSGVVGAAQTANPTNVNSKNLQ